MLRIAEYAHGAAHRAALFDQESQVHPHSGRSRASSKHKAWEACRGVNIQVMPRYQGGFVSVRLSWTGFERVLDGCVFDEFH